MRSGSISARPTWERRTGGSVSLSLDTETEDDSIDSEPVSCAPWPSEGSEPTWPTANAGNFNDGESPETWLARREKHATKARGATRASLPLAVAAKLWPTATATDASASARHGYMIKGHSGTALNDAIRTWADGSRPDPLTVRGGGDGSPTVYLSPSFVEALMGFPIGWTVSPRSGTQLSLV